MIQSDVVVVGGGAAGLRAALGLSARRVDLLIDGAVGSSGSSPRAQGGIAAALGTRDSPTRHGLDTIEAGAGLTCPQAAELLTEGAAAEIELLCRLGMPFDRLKSGSLRLGREGAHSRNRILHSNDDATGAALMQTLGEAARESPHLRISNHTRVLDLLVDRGRVVGVLARRNRSFLVVYLARAVVLTTGGVGGLYRRTTNPTKSCGSGLAMAARAGARLCDMEFVQFHPTAMDGDTDPAPLLTEALRGAGATLVDSGGAAFMRSVHHLGDLAPRDIVAREVWSRIRDGERIYLDARQVFDAKSVQVFPTIRFFCAQSGLDPSTTPIPVSPAAHYHMGGVWTDLRARSSLSGLWACGEVACTGVHGANRLASNSLLEALVFGGIAANDIDANLAEQSAGWSRLTDLDLDAKEFAVPGSVDRQVVLELRLRMWEGLGVVRSPTEMQSTIDWIRSMLDRGGRHDRLRSSLLVALLIATAALQRTESRGSHLRDDYPDSDPDLRCRQFAWIAGYDGGVPIVGLGWGQAGSHRRRAGEARS